MVIRRRAWVILSAIDSSRCMIVLNLLDERLFFFICGVMVLECVEKGCATFRDEVNLAMEFSDDLLGYHESKADALNFLGGIQLPKELEQPVSLVVSDALAAVGDAHLEELTRDLFDLDQDASISGSEFHCVGQ